MSMFNQIKMEIFIWSQEDEVYKLEKYDGMVKETSSRL